jgi:hypothetical protein
MRGITSQVRSEFVRGLNPFCADMMTRPERSTCRAQPRRAWRCRDGGAPPSRMPHARSTRGARRADEGGTLCTENQRTPGRYTSRMTSLARAAPLERRISPASPVWMSAPRSTATTTTAASTTSVVGDLARSSPARCASVSPNATTSQPRSSRRSCTCLGERLVCATTGEGTQGAIPASSRTRCSAPMRRSPAIGSYQHARVIDDRLHGGGRFFRRRLGRTLFRFRR